MVGSDHEYSEYRKRSDAVAKHIAETVYSVQKRHPYPGAMMAGPTWVPPAGNSREQALKAALDLFRMRHATAYYPAACDVITTAMEFEKYLNGIHPSQMLAHNHPNVSQAQASNDSILAGLKEELTKVVTDVMAEGTGGQKNSGAEQGPRSRFIADMPQD